MNILYLSNLSAKNFTGPRYSVPRQVLAQSKYDHVFWYNISRINKMKFQSVFPVVTGEDYPRESIKDLPVPFNHPDLIVVEQFYVFKLHKIFREIIRMNIPYIIVPRGEFTIGAQHRKFLKKLICNHLYFYHITRAATAIQYLTEREATQSGKCWNSQFLVVPNGIVRPNQDFVKKKFNQSGLVITYVGRIEKIQKGLDLLIDACSNVRELIIKKQCRINIYGPDQEGSMALLEKMIQKGGLASHIIMHEGVYGENKERILFDSDIFIMTSRSEGLPMALLEALSLGVPCLVTEGTNMADVIHDHEAGWGCRNTVEDIAKVLAKILTNRPDLEKMSRNARQLAGQYDWDLLAKDAHEKYEEILRNCKK